MKQIKALLRLFILGSMVVWWVRWASLRFRRIKLCPTDDSTPPITPDQVVAQMRRVIISDLHLGCGDRLDDFDADSELVAFIRSYVTSEQPTELILAGDTFEFLQVRLPNVGDFEWSGAAAEQRIAAILTAHPTPIIALRDFLARPDNQLTVLIGNHDFELHYAQAKARFRRELGLADDNPQLRFGLTYSGGGMYIDHGMQFDPWNSFVHVGGISEPFEVVRGTRVVKEIINRLEEDALEVAPLIDNVKPASAFLWYLLSLPRLRQPRVLQFVVRGLLMAARVNALPRSYMVKLQAITNVDGEADTKRQRLRMAAIVDVLVRRFKRPQPEPAITQIQEEAKIQLRREIREFEDALVSAIARIAASPAQSDTTLFVCGHTHNSQVVALNEQQVYINTGTWTAIIIDIVANRREEQRFPFLEVTYPNGSAQPLGRLLVWQTADSTPNVWITRPALHKRRRVEA